MLLYNVLKRKIIERHLTMNMKQQPSPMQYQIIKGKTPKKNKHK